jgi:phosphoglycolate phosphatase
MIGDRAEDIVGARENGLRSVAVTWGYGTREELEAVHPDAIVASSCELIERIRRLADVRVQSPAEPDAIRPRRKQR